MEAVDDRSIKSFTISCFQSINCQAESTEEIETLKQDVQHKTSLNEKLQGNVKVMFKITLAIN